MKMYTNAPWLNQWLRDLDRYGTPKPTGKLIVSGVVRRDKYQPQNNPDAVISSIKNATARGIPCTVGLGHTGFLRYEDSFDRAAHKQFAEDILALKGYSDGTIHIDIEYYRYNQWEDRSRKHPPIKDLWLDAKRYAYALTDVIAAFKGMKVYILQGHPLHLLPYLLSLNGIEVVVVGDEIKEVPYVSGSDWLRRLTEITQHWYSVGIDYEPMIWAGVLTNPVLQGQLQRYTSTKDYSIFWSGTRDIWPNCSREHNWYYCRPSHYAKMQELQQIAPDPRWVTKHNAEVVSEPPPQRIPEQEGVKGLAADMLGFAPVIAK